MRRFDSDPRLHLDNESVSSSFLTHWCPSTNEWRRGSESNRRIRLLQSPALPLGYPATRVGQKLDHSNEHASLYSPGLCSLIPIVERLKAAYLGFIQVLSPGSICGRGAARLSWLAKPQDNIMVKAAVTRLEFRKADARLARAAAGGCECISVSAGARALSSVHRRLAVAGTHQESANDPGSYAAKPCLRPAAEGRRMRLP